MQRLLCGKALGDEQPPLTCVENNTEQGCRERCSQRQRQAPQLGDRGHVRKQNETPAGLRQRLRQLKIVGLTCGISGADFDQARIPRQNGLRRHIQRMKQHIPVLSGGPNTFGGVVRHSPNRMKLPGGIRCKEHDAVRVDRENDIAAARPGALEMIETDLERAHAQQLPAVAQSAREIEAGQTARRPDRIETAFSATNGIVEIRTIGQVHADETRFFIPVAGCDCNSLAIENIERSRAGDAIDLLETLVDGVDLRAVTRIAQDHHHLALEREQTGQILVFCEFASQPCRVDLEPMRAGIAQPLQANLGSKPIGEKNDRHDHCCETEP